MISVIINVRQILQKNSRKGEEFDTAEKLPANLCYFFCCLNILFLWLITRVYKAYDTTDIYSSEFFIDSVSNILPGILYI